MDKSALQAVIDFWERWSIVFTLMVVVGIAGEFVTHVFSSRASKKLIALQNQEDRAQRAEIARANERTSELELQTEKLRNQNLEIQKHISPRFLTMADAKVLIEDIQAFRGHEMNFTRLDDDEAGNYLDQISYAVQRAGWRTNLQNVQDFEPRIYGVVCQVSAHPDVAVEAMVAALERANVKLRVERIANQENTWIHLEVGWKPLVL